MTAGRETRRGFWRENSLTLAFGTAFLVVLVCQAISGHAEFNEQMTVDGLQPLGFGDYLTSSDFAVDVTENWQSEFLQFFLYIFGTVYLVQRGSPESKKVHKAGSESEQEQRMGDHARPDSPRWAGTKDWRQAFYARSLGTVMGTLFVLSWLGQSITGTAAYNGRQLRQLEDPVSWAGYVATPTSGTAPCRTGSPNSSRSPPWSSCPSTSASAAPPNPSRSAPPTPRPASKADSGMPGPEGIRGRRTRGRRQRAARTPSVRAAAKIGFRAEGTRQEIPGPDGSRVPAVSPYAGAARPVAPLSVR